MSKEWQHNLNTFSDFGFIKNIYQFYTKYPDWIKEHSLMIKSIQPAFDQNRNNIRTNNQVNLLLQSEIEQLTALKGKLSELTSSRYLHFRSVINCRDISDYNKGVIKFWNANPKIVGSTNKIPISEDVKIPYNQFNLTKCK